MRKKKTPPSKEAYVIIVDGATEVCYFNMFKRYERNQKNLRINIKPELPSKKSLSEQYNYVLQSAENYTKVFWVVDLDVILKETKEAQKGTQTPLQEFDQCRKSLEKDFENVVVIINSPCLEFWFLLHYENTAKFFDTCKKAATALKKHLKDYEKTQRYFTKEGNDIYLKLKPNLSKAIANAKNLSDFDIKAPNSALAQMHLFFQEFELN